VSFLVERLINLLLLDLCVCGFATFRVESPPAFRSRLTKKRGFASGGVAAKIVAALTESRTLSARGDGKAASQSEIRAAQSEVNGK